MARLFAALLCATTIAGVATATAQAQSVRGRVLDADTRQPIAGVQVSLRNARSVVVAEGLTSSDGLFHLAARDAGTHRLEGTHIAYGPVRTEPIEIRRDEQVSVDLNMSMRAIVLEPVTVTGRRRDPRHDATYEGLYARHATLPPIGSRRVVLASDPEMMGATYVRQTLDWFEARRAPCTIVFFRGRVVHSPVAANAWLYETPVDHLEGVEYYRRWSDAPFALRDTPFYIHDPWPCSVVAVWPARPAGARLPGGP